jgi:hypothetical protein
MRRAAILTIMAIAGGSAASAPAFARGGGGGYHGGGHVAFGGGLRAGSPRVSVLRGGQPGFAPRLHGGPQIRPEMIAVPRLFGYGPIVLPFGLYGSGPDYAGLPLVITPALDESSKAAPALPSSADTTAVQSACHAIAGGYHCDWPS